MKLEMFCFRVIFIGILILILCIILDGDWVSSSKRLSSKIKGIIRAGIPVLAVFGVFILFSSFSLWCKISQYNDVSNFDRNLQFISKDDNGSYYFKKVSFEFNILPMISTISIEADIDNYMYDARKEVLLDKLNSIYKFNDVCPYTNYYDSIICEATEKYDFNKLCKMLLLPFRSSGNVNELFDVNCEYKENTEIIKLRGTFNSSVFTSSDGSVTSFYTIQDYKIYPSENSDLYFNRISTGSEVVMELAIPKNKNQGKTLKDFVVISAVTV